MEQPPPVRVTFAGRTDNGLMREHNEDGFLIVDLERPESVFSSADAASGGPICGNREATLREKGALLLVCDGMGGAAAGEVAAAMALERVSSLMLDPPPDPPLPDGAESDPKAVIARRFRAAAVDSNTRILQSAKADHLRSGMGTTMTGVCITASEMIMAQVGDSRAYVLRNGVLTQMTRDQSLVNQLLETGQMTEEEARMFEHSNVILQALGVQEEVEVQLSTVPLRRGDRLMVCTDGLTGVVDDDELAGVLGRADDNDTICETLVEMARDGGGPDNITVLVARFDDEGLPEPQPSDKIEYVTWRLDLPDEKPAPMILLPPTEAAPQARQARTSPRVDPAKAFFSVMVLLALIIGGTVGAFRLRRGASTVPCTVAAASGFAVQVDGINVGRRTRGSGITLRLPPGPHRVSLRRRGASSTEQLADVRSDGECRVEFGEAP